MSYDIMSKYLKTSIARFQRRLTLILVQLTLHLFLILETKKK